MTFDVCLPGVRASIGQTGRYTATSRFPWHQTTRQQTKGDFMFTRHFVHLYEYTDAAL